MQLGQIGHFHNFASDTQLISVIALSADSFVVNQFMAFNWPYIQEFSCGKHVCIGGCSSCAAVWTAFGLTIQFEHRA